MSILRWASVLAVLAALPLSAQEKKDKHKDRERHRDDDTEYATTLDTVVPLSKGGSIDLSLVAGEIEIVGWSRNEVKVHAYSEHGTLRFDASPSRVTLGIRSHRGRSGDTRYELSVPTGARVLMGAVSGDLSVRGVRGEVEARTVSGEIDIADASDRISFTSVSGSVRAANLDGIISGNSVSGEIEIENARGEIDVETVSGEILMSRVQSKYVRAGTTSGEVEYTGSVDPAGRYEFSSHSGDVRLVLPADIGATFSVETFSGSIDSEFPITLGASEPLTRAKRFEFKIGDGKARISAESFSGSIIIERGMERAEPRE